MPFTQLYRQIAEAVHDCPEREDLVEAVFTVACDPLDAEVRDRLDEVLHRTDVPVEPPELPDPPEDRRGYTEAEAAQRWCPFAREVTPVGKSKKDAAIGNRYETAKDDFTNPAGCRCIASHCMAWRFISVDRGYCGLASAVLHMPANEPRHLHNRMPPPREPPQEPDLFDLYAADSCRGVISSTT
jgi:hypothetical protein